MNWDRLLADAESGVTRVETELGRLRAEVKRLKDECEEWRADHERLRAALEAALVPLATFILSGEIDKNEWLGPELKQSIRDGEEQARAALEGP